MSLEIILAPKTRGPRWSTIHFSSATDEWETPPDVYKSLHEEFNFDFDPVPLGGTLGLVTSWAGRRVFCNPPYSNIPAFLAKATEPDLAVFLIPSRTDTKWFHRLIVPHAREVRFIEGRLRFVGAKHSAPFPSMIVVFGK